MVRYKSAIRIEDGVLVQIAKDTERGFHYTCPCCKHEMRPVLGELKEVHFRHKGNPCQYDKYLHSFAEELFLQEYRFCLDNGVPFILALDSPLPCNGACVLIRDRNCKEHYIHSEIDLTKQYPKISKERRISINMDDYRRPDILLESDDGKQLWIEIFVTHKTIEQKLEEAQKRNIPVIEIQITDEQCKGIKSIREHKVEESGFVALHNFDFKPEQTPRGVILPCMRYLVFEAYAGRIRFTDEPPSESRENVDYTIGLRLNHLSDWRTPDEKGKYGERKLTLDEVDEYCWKRCREYPATEYEHLIVYEKRSPHIQIDSEKTRNEDVLEPPILDSKPSVQEQPIAIDFPQVSEWLDLGFKSGTLWYNRDSKSVFPPEGYIESLPTVQDIEELMGLKNKFLRKGAFYTAPNGKTIAFHWGEYALKDEYGRVWILIYDNEQPWVYCATPSQDKEGKNRYRFVAKRVSTLNHPSVDKQQDNKSETPQYKGPASLKEDNTSASSSISIKSNHYFMEDGIG